MMIQYTTIDTKEPITATRLAFEMAMQHCINEGARLELAAALEKHEARWRAMAEMARQKAQNAGQAATADSTPPAEPRKLSVVEQFGFDSPEAQAMREARRAARVAAAAEKAGGAPTITDAERVNVETGAGTDAGEG